MTTSMAESRAVNPGEGSLGIVAEELRKLRFALDELTCRMPTNSENIEFIAKALRTFEDELVSLEGTEHELEKPFFCFVVYHICSILRLKRNTKVI